MTEVMQLRWKYFSNEIAVNILVESETVIQLLGIPAFSWHFNKGTSREGVAMKVGVDVAVEGIQRETESNVFRAGTLGTRSS